MLRNSKRREDKMGKRNQFPQLDSVNRIRNIPIVETGWIYASDLYQKVKKSNSLVSWGLGTAESSVQATLELTLPMVSVFEGPISLVDTLLCKSLDIVEQRLPAVKLPPDQLLENTKEYMNTTVLQPVLRRANSVKQFGLDQAVSAADRLESALDVADKYVDEYLPDIAGGPPEENKETNNLSGNNNKALKTIHRVDRFSRKLQRRLTQHTLAEAKAFKHYGKDALQFVMYSAELMAKDPRTAMAKLADLWESLSQDEPENQARPANLEQLTFMVTRELARRVVHLVNHSREGIAALPELLQFAAQYCSALADHIIKSMHIDGAKDAAIAHARAQFVKLEAVLKEITSYANLLLVRAEQRNDCSTSQWTTSQQQVQRYYGLKKQPSLFCKQPECSGLKRQTCLRLSYELSIIYSHNKYTFKYLSHLIAYSC